MNTALSFVQHSPTVNEQLGDDIAKLAAHIHAATYRLLMMIRDFDEREAWAEMGAKSCAQWLNWRCGISPHTAREKIRVAHALTSLPLTSEAFEKGQLSYSKVRALTRCATTNNEDVLLNIALHATASQVERVVRCQVRNEREAEVRANAKAAYVRREFNWRQENDGSVTFYGRLPAEMAEHVINAIEAIEADQAGEANEANEANEAYETNEANLANKAHETYETPQTPKTPQPHKTGEISETIDVYENHKTYREKQNNEQRARGHQHSNNLVNKNVPAGTSSEPQSENNFKTRRADALVKLAEQHCKGYEVLLHVPAGTSLQANALEHCGTISQVAAERLCCDAAIVPVHEDAQGNVLDIGRRTRKIPPAIRRALDIRDKGSCRFPGCTHTHYLHGHHIQHWAHGGKTCLDNLVSLCSHHHHLVHEGGFGCQAIPRKKGRGVHIVFRRPNGVIVPQAFRLKAVNGQVEEQQRTLTIDEFTCASEGVGMHLDVDLVLDGLRSRSEV